MSLLGLCTLCDSKPQIILGYHNFRSAIGLPDPCYNTHPPKTPSGIELGILHLVGD